MRLTSVLLRHYRVHRELHVELDRSRTVVGGPNESGKSTLVEAIHRALFLEAKGNTKQHRAMISTLYPGHPEVELVFEAGGVNYQLKKRFGASGTVTLAASNAAPLAGEAAESELARLLGVEAVAGSKLATQWGHLWIWQGSAGDDPLERAATQQASLLRRLQDAGGAAAMQSDLDSQVARLFAAKTAEIFTQQKAARAGTDLDKAETVAAVTEEARKFASARLERSRQLVRDYDEATQMLAGLAETVEGLAEQKLAVETKLHRVDELRARESGQTGSVRALAEKHTALEQAHRQIVQVRATLETNEAALIPQSAECARLAEARESARQQADASASAYDAACDRTRAARRRRDFAVACQTRLDTAARLHELAARLAQAKTHEDEIAKLRPELARLPEIDAGQVRQWQKLESAQASADATLQAMAAGLEVLAAPAPVLIAGAPLAVGQSRILTEETEITIGEYVRLLVRPGGGTSLAEARQHAQDARLAFRKALDAQGVATVAAAAEIVARRAELTTQIGLAESALRGLGAAKLTAAFADARDADAAAQAEVDRRSGVALTAPATLAEAKKAVADEERQLREAEAGEAQAKSLRDSAAAAFHRAEAALTAHQEKIARQTRDVAELQAQLRLLLKTHGEDETRLPALAAAEASLTAARELLTGTTRALTERQPELLASDFTRLRSALERAETGQRTTELKQAVALAGLRSDGAEDPEAALALATAQARSAQEHLASVRRKAEAFRLLNELFLDEQRALAERFTSPLADRISGYLECIFGAGARAQVVLAESSFSGLQLLRPVLGGGAIPFDQLSGGTREQVAAAVRLAMAEVLCNDHHGCLPVIFDDAFAYSDPERVQILQRMLYLAAERGLQVIVLTCDPGDYAALGAAEVMLRAVAA